jgi:hypothetical protein
MSTSIVTRGGTIPRAMQMHQLAVMQAAGSDKSLNAGLSGCTTIPSTSSLTLPYTSLSRGTQAPPTTGSSLDLGPSVAYQVLRQAKTTTNYSKEMSSVPG